MQMTRDGASYEDLRIGVRRIVAKRNENGNQQQDNHQPALHKSAIHPPPLQMKQM